MTPNQTNPLPWSNQTTAPQPTQYRFTPPPPVPNNFTPTAQRISNQIANNFNTCFVQPTPLAQPAQQLQAPHTQPLQTQTAPIKTHSAQAAPAATPQEPSKHVLHGRPVIELDHDTLNHLVPNALILHTSKYLKRANCYLFRGRAVGVRMRLATAIFDKSIRMLELASELNKRRNNLTLIYELDGTHEALRVLWFTYYDSGFLGDYKNKGKVYQPQEALRLFRLINEQLDTIGRLIGAAKNRAQEAKGQTKPVRNA